MHTPLPPNQPHLALGVVRWPLDHLHMQMLLIHLMYRGSGRSGVGMPVVQALSRSAIAIK